MGKTVFVIEMFLRLSNGYKCAMFSLEMSKQQLYFRMMSNLMQVNFELFRTGRLAPNHYQNMQKYKDELKKLYIDATRAVSADYIADEMRRLKRTQGLDFVVVDYLQDVKEQGEINDNGGSALARVCRKLRAAAKECDCHVMGLSQVVRGVEDRKDKRPGNADLSGSTGIETNADVIALLYRDITIRIVRNKTFWKSILPSSVTENAERWNCIMTEPHSVSLNYAEDNEQLIARYQDMLIRQVEAAYQKGEMEPDTYLNFLSRVCEANTRGEIYDHFEGLFNELVQYHENRLRENIIKGAEYLEQIGPAHQKYELAMSKYNKLCSQLYENKERRRLVQRRMRITELFPKQA